MAGRGCAIANERAARIKATKQRVFISGLKGDHTLETGVAYHYRGHFIYAYPAGNPIEPVPFSTKKGINIVGVVQDQAPLYDFQQPSLVYENTIAALERSCVHEWEWQKEQEEIRKLETKKALEEEEAGEEKKETGTETKAVAGSAKDIDAAATPKASAQEPLPSQAPSRVPSFTTLLVPSQVSSYTSSRTGSRTSSNSRPALAHRNSSYSSNTAPRIGAVEAPATTTANDSPQAVPAKIYTPHDRGHYLAYSAPGSRNASVDNTPFVSRPVSPTHQHGGLSVRSGQGHGSLRPVASTSRLNQLLAAEGIRRSLSPLADVAENVSNQPNWQAEDMVANLSVSQGWMHPDDISAFVETVSRRPSPSRLSSRSRSRPLSSVRGRSPRTTSPDNEEFEGGSGSGGLYLHGLGHPDVIRHDASSRAQTPVPSPASRGQTRENSPLRVQGHRAEESAAYLRGLAQRHYEMVNPGSGSNTPARHEDVTQSTSLSSRAQTPIGQAPTGSRAGPSQQRDTTPAFIFPAARVPDTSSFPAFVDPISSPSYTVHTDKKPLNTGRPRAASKALNEAYNAANPSSTPRPVFPSASLPSNEQTEHTKGNDTETENENATFTTRCPIHSESCNGEYVVHTHMTERARNSSGFKDLFPTIQCEDGRVMVNWAKMKDEEMERMKMEA